MQTNKLFPQSSKPIGLCSDHAGFEMKKYIISLLESEDVRYKDFGCFSPESCDYPDYAHLLGAAIDKGECELGIAICGTGNGINMALNKHQGVRAALCWMGEIAHYARAHNNANVLTIPGRIVANDEARHIIRRFFKAEYEGGRHQIRIDKIPYKG